MSANRSGGRAKPGLPDEYWQKKYDMREAELDRLRNELAEWHRALPDCLTCHGAGMEPRNFSDTPCRDCSDGEKRGTGKVSISKLVGLWSAATDPASDLHNVLVNMALDQFIGGHPAPVDVLPTTCNCTEEGLPYCGRPDCDVDWCYACGDEYTEPCPRHAEVGRP